ncbi:methylmalonyl-CoA mutase [Geodermatophilus sp. SYSU D00710]
MTDGERLRVVVAGPGGSDDPRALVLARALRDAGAEVVLTGATAADRLAATVVQEDADAVGVAGPPPGLPAALLDRLAAAGVDDVTAFVLGGADGLPVGVLRFADGTPPGDVVAALRRAGTP